MSALSEMLEHSQAKALAQLYKAYTRREEKPDDAHFAQEMREAGLEDELQIKFLLRCWRVLREYPESLPVSGAPAPKQPKQVVEDRVWTAGKHEGVTLADTPADYLEWAAESHPDPIARAASKEELQRRAEGVPF